MSNLPQTKHILNPNFREGTYAWAEDQASYGRRVMRQFWMTSGAYMEFSEHSENGRLVIRFPDGHYEYPTADETEATDWVLVPEAAPKRELSELLDGKLIELEGHLNTLRKALDEGLDDASLRKWAIETTIDQNRISDRDLDMQATINEAEKLVAYVEKGTETPSDCDSATQKS